MYLNPQIHGTQDTLTIHVGYLGDTIEDTSLEPYLLIRLHPIYMITGDPHAPLRATRAVYTPRGDTHAPDMKPP